MLCGVWESKQWYRFYSYGDASVLVPGRLPLILGIDPIGRK